MRIKGMMFGIAICCSSCGLFKNVEKNKAVLENSTAQEINKGTSETDQGIINTVERWMFNGPASAAPVDLKSFTPPDFNAIAGDAKALSDAFNGVNTENKRLLDIIDGMKGFMYEKQTSERKDETKVTSEKESLSSANKQEVSTVKKEPSSNLTVIIISCFALLLALIFGVIIYIFRGLKKDVQLIKAAAGLIKSE